MFSLPLNLVRAIMSPWCVKLYTFNSQYNEVKTQPSVSWSFANLSCCMKMDSASFFKK